MTVEEMAAFLRQYEQAKSKTDPFRYTSRVSSVAAFPDVFGVNFPAVMGAPDAEKAAIFLAQEQRAELVRRLMRGGSCTGGGLRLHLVGADRVPRGAEPP